MILDSAVTRTAALLKQLRQERRVERGRDAMLSTWDRLFGGLGYQLRLDAAELCEEAGDLLTEEAERRRERRRAGLLAR